MGVSADSGGDLSTVMSGGKEFVARLAQFQDAQTNLNKAISDLNLGKSAKEAYDDAGRVLAEAKAKRDADMAALTIEINNAREGVKTWADQAKATAQAALDEANAELTDAKAQNAAATSARKEAGKVLAAAQAQAATIATDANAAAATIISDATKQAAALTKDVAALQAKEAKALARALDVENEFKAKLATLQAAASAVSG